MTTKTNNILTKFREIMLIVCTFVTMGGTAGIFIQIGEYKQMVDNLINKINKIEITIDANASENRIDHFNIYKEIYGKRTK